jgi:hypothetical protein
MIEGHLTLLATNPITKYSKKPAEGGGGEKKKLPQKGRPDWPAKQSRTQPKGRNTTKTGHTNHQFPERDFFG